VLGQRLLMVMNGVAFVEITRVSGIAIETFAEGADLPGAGRITRLEWVNGRWELEAGDVLLAAARN
jgi:hypothetical protein